MKIDLSLALWITALVSGITALVFGATQPEPDPAANPPINIYYLIYTTPDTETPDTVYGPF